MKFLNHIAEKYPVTSMLGFGSIGGTSALTIEHMTAIFQMAGAFFGMLASFCAFVGAAWVLIRRSMRKKMEKKHHTRRKTDKDSN